MINLELGKSKEDYLKAVLILQKRMSIVRSVDLAQYLQIKDELILSLPGLDIYPDRRKVYRNSNEINLTTKEFEIFYLLVVNRGVFLHMTRYTIKCGMRILLAMKRML